MSDIAATDAAQQAIQQAVSPTPTDIAAWIDNSWGRAFGLAMPSALLAMRALPVQRADTGMDNEAIAELSVRLGGVLARASGLRQQLMGAMAIEAGHADYVPAHHIATVCALSLLDAEMRHTEQTGRLVEISQAMVTSIVLPFASLAINDIEQATLPSRPAKGAALPTRLMLLGLLWGEFYRFFDLLADLLAKDSGEKETNPTEALVLFLEAVCGALYDQLDAIVQAAQLTTQAAPDALDTASYKKQLLVVVQPIVARVLTVMEQNAKDTALFSSVESVMAGITTLLQRECSVLRTGILLLLQAHQERVTGTIADTENPTTDEDVF